MVECFLQYLAQDITPNGISGIHCLAQDGFDLNTVHKICTKEKKNIKPVVLRPPCNGKRYNLRKHADLIKAGHVEACLTPSRRVSDKCSCSFFRQRNVKPWTLKNALSRSMKKICKKKSMRRVNCRIQSILRSYLGQSRRLFELLQLSFSTIW